MPFKFGGGNKCAICTKTVYPMEETKFEGSSYHNDCFKCSICNKKIQSVSSAGAMHGTVSHKKCFSEQFKTSGGKYGGEKVVAGALSRQNSANPSSTTAKPAADEDAAKKKAEEEAAAKKKAEEEAAAKKKAEEEETAAAEAAAAAAADKEEEGKQEAEAEQKEEGPSGGSDGSDAKWTIKDPKGNLRGTVMGSGEVRDASGKCVGFFDFEEGMCYTDAEKSGLVGGCIEDEEEGTGMSREDREAMLKYSVLNQNEELVGKVMEADPGLAQVRDESNIVVCIFDEFGKVSDQWNAQMAEIEGFSYCKEERLAFAVYILLLNPDLRNIEEEQ